MGTEQVLAQEIASQLQEKDAGALDQLTRAIDVCGAELVQEILQETNQVESQGGMLVPDSSRRRTAGGVFFYLLRKRVSKEHWYAIRPEIAPKEIKEPSLEWAARAEAVKEAMQGRGYGKRVTLTVQGKVREFKRKERIMILTVEGGQQLTGLPKYVPQVSSLPTTYKVCMAFKQWHKVESWLKNNPDDEVIATGYPVLNEKTGSILLLTASATTLLLQKTVHEAPKDEPHEN
jgi:hypothetical protein